MNFVSDQEHLNKYFAKEVNEIIAKPFRRYLLIPYLLVLMKYYLVTWTAENPDGENFSGNASMQWDGVYPSDEDIIENIKFENPKLENFRMTIQDKLEFNSQEELDNYGNK